MNGVIKLDAAGFAKVIKDVSENLTILVDNLNMLKEEVRELSNAWIGNDKRAYVEVINIEICELEDEINKMLEIIKGINESAKSLVIAKRKAEDLVNTCLFI